MYPYDRGVALLREIRKLGPKEGRTFMDQFRLLITEIGNALVSLCCLYCIVEASDEIVKAELWIIIARISVCLACMNRDT